MRKRIRRFPFLSIIARTFFNCNYYFDIVSQSNVNESLIQKIKKPGPVLKVRNPADDYFCFCLRRYRR